jgi:hypothetical protein
MLLAAEGPANWEGPNGREAEDDGAAAAVHLDDLAVKKKKHWLNACRLNASDWPFGAKVGEEDKIFFTRCHAWRPPSSSPSFGTSVFPGAAEANPISPPHFFLSFPLPSSHQPSPPICPSSTKSAVAN